MARPHLAHDVAGPKNGVPFVLLHGFPFDRSIWDTTSQDLVRAGCRIVAVDLPGHGRSDAVPGATMGTMGEAVAETLAALGIGPAVWIGHSMGGYVALERYSSVPADVLGLGLVCTRAGGDDADGQAARDAMVQGIEGEGMDAVVRTMLDKVLCAQVRAASPDLVRRVEGIMARTSPAGAIAAVRAMRDRNDHTALLGQILVPTLVVAGGEDPIIPPDAAHAMADDIAHARVRTVEAAAHMPMLEAAEAFAEVLVDWVTENTRTSSWQALSTSRK